MIIAIKHRSIMLVNVEIVFPKKTKMNWNFLNFTSKVIFQIIEIFLWLYENYVLHYNFLSTPEVFDQFWWQSLWSGSEVPKQGFFKFSISESVKDKCDMKNAT